MAQHDLGTEGLWRTLLAGPGRSLTEVFANLDRTAGADRIERHPKQNMVGARVSVSPDQGEGYWQFTQIKDDIYVVVWNFSYKNPRFEVIPGDGLIQFGFVVTGDLTLAISGGESLRLNRPSLLVWAQSPGVDIPEWTAPSAQERMITISVRPQFLVDRFTTSIADMPARLQAFMSQPESKLDYFQLPLTAQMFDVATKLINNPYKGALALAYTEALTLELLCAAVGTFCTLPASSPEECTERHRRCLHAAHLTLMRELSPAPTIQKLARAVGMAEAALTKGFKAMYGETIFDFSLRCRMQHALTLLRDRQWSVDKVSEAVGYSHPTSFATAFRRHFGVRPIDVKGAKSDVEFAGGCTYGSGGPTVSSIFPARPAWNPI